MNHDRYIEAPDQLPLRRILDQGLDTVFLAGGISGTEDWQRSVTERLLATSNLFVINPRRATGLGKTGEEAKAQIEWEFDALRQSNFVMFWFPPETVCPIALFELGTFLGRGRNYMFSGNSPIDGAEDLPKAWPYVYVGCHPEYVRRFDLEQQVPLYDPRITIEYDLEHLTNVVIEDAAELIRRRDQK